MPPIQLRPSVEIAFVRAATIVTAPMTAERRPHRLHPSGTSNANRAVFSVTASARRRAHILYG
jgi:hypothetical protein